jgi:transcriptional regulator with XRE-family HTH domain
MLSDTLKDELDAYGIGRRLRSLRLKKKLGLVELGSHTGLSPALLSKLETGRLYPTLPTLQRIALVFGVGLDHFFNKENRAEPAIVHTSDERMRFADKAGARDVSYEFESLDYKALNRPMSAYLAEFHAVDPEKARGHAHAGVELIFVISGTLGLRVGEEEIAAKAGDSVYLDSTRPHAYRRIGKAKCTAVIVTVPVSEMTAPRSGS